MILNFRTLLGWPAQDDVLLENIRKSTEPTKANDQAAYNLWSRWFWRKLDLTGALTVTGGGTADATVVNPLTGALTVAGGGAADATVVNPLTGTVAVAGGGAAEATIVSPLTGSLTPAGGGAAEATVVNPLTGNLSFAGAGAAETVIVSPLTGTLAVVGGGAAETVIVNPLSGMLVIEGGGEAAATIVLPLTGTLAVAGGGAAVARVVSPLTGHLNFTGGGAANPTILNVPRWKRRSYLDEFTEVDRDNHLAVTADAISWWTVPPPPHGPDWNWAYIYGPHRLRDNINVRTTATYEQHSSFVWGHKAYILELYAAAPPNFYPEVAVYYEYFSSTLMGCWLAARSTNQAVRLGSTVSRGIEHRVTLHKHGALATAEFENWTGTEWGTPATASVDCAPDPLPILTVARFESWPPGANPPGVPICVMGPLEVQLQAVRPRPIEFGTFALGR